MSYFMQYKQYDYKKYDGVRKYFLSFAVFLDVCAIGIIFSALISPLYWILFAFLIGLSILTRIYANKFPAIYNYGIKDDEFIINKCVPANSKCILRAKISEISIKHYDFNTFDRNNDRQKILIYDNSCQNKSYVIEFNGKSVIIGLDEYLYTLLKSKIEVE